MNNLKKITPKKHAIAIKKAIALLLMFTFYFQMWGNNEPQFLEGTQVYVVAQSGLTLRAKPNIRARSLGVIDFGSQLIVLDQVDSLKTLKINWVDGQWIKVDYEGLVGYMFDGYLSDLPLPEYDFERCQMDLDLIYPLESWAEHNLGLDTTTYFETRKTARTTAYFETGDKLIKAQSDDIYKIDLYLTDTRIMDVYHLLQSMVEGKKLSKTFTDSSTFIENKEGQLSTIKITLDNPVKIRLTKNGDIKVTIHSQDYICAE
ncbi:MAG: SH3 domain-containing protein [Saprospiraceae bacterium]